MMFQTFRLAFHGRLGVMQFSLLCRLVMMITMARRSRALLQRK